jgi:sulfite exporter TauE/SafE
MYLYSAFFLGLLGSFHCLGMCGPLALALPLSKDNPWQTLREQMWYQGGRVGGYSFMGGVAGVLGSSALMAGMQGWLSLATGILIALLCLLSYLGVTKHLASRLAAVLAKRLQRLWPYFYARRGRQSLLLLGFLNSFLPCGLVYIALASALNTAHGWHAVFFMMLFGLGTVPALLLLLQGSQLVNLRLRSYLARLVPVLVLLVAVLLIVRGLQLGIPYLSPAAGRPCCCHQEAE